MKQLIRLDEVKLYKYTTTQSSDGDYSKTYSLIDTYKVIVEELTDDISSQLYGAEIINMVRISSVNNSLETYLYGKINNTSDNVSKYEIEFNSNKYEIKNIRKSYIDCKRL